MLSWRCAVLAFKDRNVSKQLQHNYQKEKKYEVKDTRLITVEQRGVCGVEWASARHCRDFYVSVISQPAAATTRKTLSRSVMGYSAKHRWCRSHSHDKFIWLGFRSLILSECCQMLIRQLISFNAAVQPTKAAALLVSSFFSHPHCSSADAPLPAVTHELAAYLFITSVSLTPTSIQTSRG